MRAALTPVNHCIHSEGHYWQILGKYPQYISIEWMKKKRMIIKNINRKLQFTILLESASLLEIVSTDKKYTTLKTSGSVLENSIGKTISQHNLNRFL